MLLGIPDSGPVSADSLSSAIEGFVADVDDWVLFHLHVEVTEVMR